MSKVKYDHFDKLSPTILQVLPSLSTGGVEGGTIELALALKRKGFRPLVASRGGKLVEFLDREGIEHITLPLHSKNPIQMILNIFRLLHLIKDKKVSLLHVRSRAPAWSAKFACALANIPFVTTFHGTYNFHHKPKRFYNSIMVQGHRVIAVSTFIRKHIAQNYNACVQMDKVVVISRGIDLTKYNRCSISPDRISALRLTWKLQKNVPLILMPARLTRWKGQLILLKALQILKEHRVPFQCVLAGSAQGRVSYRQELLNFISSAQLNDCVQLEENCQDIPAAYALADLVVHASTDAEAFGRVIVEAQAMEVPVVASNLGAPAEIIEENKTGWLHQSGDCAELAFKIERILMLSQTARSKVIGNALQRVRKEYGNQLMFDRTISVYEGLLKTWHQKA